MRILRISLCVFLGFLTGFRGISQYDSALLKESRLNPQEKIYIHYDKDYYITGETIWFKAYFFNQGAPSGISSNFFLEFIDPAGKIIFQNKYPILGAVAKGNITIPDSLASGEYTIRGLTPLMLNADPGFIYLKSIPVFKGGEKVAINKPAARNISLQFFPESGDLVDGLLTVVAFKAVDQWGQPVEVEGTIRSTDGTGIAPFKSYHDGMGKTQFIPQIARQYTAELIVDGVNKTFPLPAVKAKGVNLKVQDEKGGKVFQLAVGKNGREDFKVLTLVVEINNSVIYNNEIDMENYPSVRGHLLTDSLPSGILHFTVFNNNNLPIAERLAFVDNHEYASALTLNLTRTGIAKREENNFELEFGDSVQHSCSISITDATMTAPGSVENIYSKFLLTSDLKGFVYNPAWYFITGDSSRQGIDNLLLTHGWSRFQWTKILSGEFSGQKFADSPLITLKGFVNDANDKAGISGGKLNFYIQGEDSSTQTYAAEVDSKGWFALKSISFHGKSRLYYTYSNPDEKLRPVKLHLGEDELDKNVWNGLPPMASTGSPMFSGPKDDEIQRRYQELKREAENIKELEKVVVTSKSSKKPIDIVNERYTTGVFRSMGKENIDNVNNPVGDKSMNAVDFIKNRIQQVEIQGGTFVNRKNFSLISGQKWNVEVFVNESPSNLAFLRTIRADDIALVKFYEAGFVGVSSGAPGGAIAVYTKELSAEDFKIEKMEFVTANGYSVTKEFYHPDYSVPNPNLIKVDNRTTLYWNPDVYTDAATNKFPIHFFNNDYSKKFKLVIEGFDANGKLVHLEKIIGN